VAAPGPAGEAAHGPMERARPRAQGCRRPRLHARTKELAARSTRRDRYSVAWTAGRRPSTRSVKARWHEARSLLRRVDGGTPTLHSFGHARGTRSLLRRVDFTQHSALSTQNSLSALSTFYSELSLSTQHFLLSTRHSALVTLL
jgi:hypothetical protein